MTSERGLPSPKRSFSFAQAGRPGRMVKPSPL
jgi:hypothetical protein